MSDFDGVGAGDVMTLEECVAVIDDLTARLAAAEATINAACDALNDAPEINPSNYDHDQVWALNRETCFAFSILNAHVAARGGE